jgi:hypothetical protein
MVSVEPATRRVYASARDARHNGRTIASVVTVQMLPSKRDTPAQPAAFDVASRRRAANELGERDQR